MNKPAMLQQKFTVQVTTLPDCDDITRFDGIDELIDTNPKCRLFFNIDLQEYLAALICLSADEICQPFSWGWGGNFYVDSGIHFTEL
jgi:hypothetical protein